MKEVVVLMDVEHQIDLLNWEGQPIVVEDPWEDLDIAPLYFYY